MKRNIIALITLLMLSLPTAMLAKTFDFDKITEMEGVTSAHISKAMFKLIAGMGIQSDGIDLKSVLPKLESLHIITCEKPEVIAILKKEAEIFRGFKKMKYLWVIFVDMYCINNKKQILS